MFSDIYTSIEKKNNITKMNGYSLKIKPVVDVAEQAPVGIFWLNFLIEIARIVPESALVVVFEIQLCSPGVHPHSLTWALWEALT